jgi:hypothetical protein
MRILYNLYMRYGSIYLVTNLITKKRYVGITTTTIKKRWISHCSPGGSCTYLHNSIKTHGKQNFLVEEICSAYNKRNLEFLEEFFINYYNTLADNDKGYNLTYGKGFQGKQSKITCNKKSDFHTLWWKNNKSDIKKIKSKMSGVKAYVDNKKIPIICINISTKKVKRFQDMCNTGEKSPGNIHRAIKNKGIYSNKIWAYDTGQTQEDMEKFALIKLKGEWQPENEFSVISENIHTGEIKEFPNIYEITINKDVGTIRKVIHKKLNYTKDWKYKLKT